MKKQASNLLKLAVIAGFMTGAAAKADHHEKDAAKDATKAEKAKCKGEKAKCKGKHKCKGEKAEKDGCGAETCATEKKEEKKH